MKVYFLSVFTLVAIYLVVLAGGIVRMTGSGMGCPDWPKCFDQYIPPTQASELPDNYKEIYASKRSEKINRFGNFLTALGFENKAKELRADKSLLVEQDFNVFNTWTEYINRLAGVLAGLLILIQLVVVSVLFKTYKWAIPIGFILLLITLFQAWFGAMVVATNIVPWVLTIHMMLAIVMIIVQIIFCKYIHSKSIIKPSFFINQRVSKSVLFMLALGLLLMIIQTFWGTQVRQQVDEYSKIIAPNNVIDQLNSTYIFHRSLAIGFLIIAFILAVINYKSKLHATQLYFIVGIVVIEAIVGKLFSVLDMASFLKPTHLLLSMILVGLLFSAFLNFFSVVYVSKNKSL